MIEEQTIFILGAGANCSYDYPSGEELKAKVVTAVRESVGGSSYVGIPDNSFLVMAKKGLVPMRDVRPERCTAFYEALEMSGQASIDAFLNANRHKKGFEAIGKGAIAQVLLDYERRKIPQSKDDWLNYLFQLMLDGVSSPEKFIERNKVHEPRP